MPKSNNNFKNLALGLALLAVSFAQSACTNAGDSAPSNAANSNVSTALPAANANGNYAAQSEPLKNNERLSNNPPIRADQTYSDRAGSLNQIQPMANESQNGSENYSGDYRTSPQSGSIPNAPEMSGGNYSADSRPMSESESLPNTPVMHDLEFAIDRWCDSEAASYGLRATLISLWRQKNPTVKYNPVGIDGLTGRIRARPAFANCRRAKELNRNMFHDDGIRTVGQLYDYLEPCGGE